MVTKEIDLNKRPALFVVDSEYDKYPKPTDKTLRISTGNALNAHYALDINELPKSLLVDYVKVYKKAGHNAAEIEAQKSICEDGGTYGGALITSRHIPKATYSWNTNLFSPILISPESNPYKYWSPWYSWGTLNSSVIGNNFYTLSNNVKFPSGYSETNSISIYVAEVPLAPTSDIYYRDDQNSCFYQVQVRKLQPDAVYSWSTDGMSWKPGTDVSRNGQMYSEYYLPVGEAVTKTYYIKVSTFCGDNTDYNNYSTSPNCSFKYDEKTDNEDMLLEENKEDVNYFDVIDLYGRTLFSGKNYSSNHLLLKKLNTGIYVIKLYNENYDYLQSFQVFVSN